MSRPRAACTTLAPVQGLEVFDFLYLFDAFTVKKPTVVPSLLEFSWYLEEIIVNQPAFPYRIFSLGDQALSVDYGNTIDETINEEVIARYYQLKNEHIDGITELIPAYSSLTICYDLITIKKHAGSLNGFDWVKKLVEEKLEQRRPFLENKSDHIKIPVCYDREFGVDLPAIAESKNLSMDEIISIHCSKKYKVFMLGFLPGFAYMGTVDDRIAMPRKSNPVNVIPGSVGIAGIQTGIYPLFSPGGWQIIGRTPLALFNSSKEQPSLLKAGDSVSFYPIAKKEFVNF